MRDGIADVLAEVAVANDAPKAAPEAVLPASLAAAAVSPKPRPVVAEGAAGDPTGSDVPETAEPVLTAALAPEGEVVTRMTTAGGRHWGINVGLFTTRHEAEKMLLQTALVEIGTLDTALRKVVRSPQGFRANFVGLTEQNAELVCRRLEAQNVPCRALSPS